MSELAVNTLAERAPTIGDNSGAVPLTEILLEEIASDKKRADELIEAAASSKIANDEDAAKVVTLIRLLDTHEKAMDTTRDGRMRPFLDTVRTINGTYNPIIERMTLCRAGPLLPGSTTKRRGGLLEMVDTYEKKREAEAEAERQRVLAEQRRQAEEAERAQREADEAKAKGQGALAAELDAIKAREEADRLTRQAETIRPAPIRSAVGAVRVQREIVFEITEIRKALGWLVRVRGSEITQAARTIIGKHLASLGVDAVEAGVVIPGVTARVDKRTQVR